jgi:aspartyl-tRNA(Asn)/glutamyl-tRNA(Gln) amidotransferase subunit C
MNITRDDVLRVAELANLELSEAEIATYGAQLASILSYCEKLNELDTAAVEPLAQILEVGGSRLDSRSEQKDGQKGQHLREDAPRDAAIIREVIRRAPEAADSDPPYFRVPKVIDR